MSINIVLNGSTYVIPTTDEVGWGSNVNDFFVAIAAGCLQKTGGAFALTAEADFGATYGLKSAYYKSRATNPSSAGVIRLGSGESVSWRNNANSGDLPLTTNASDSLLYNSNVILTENSTSSTPQFAGLGLGSALVSSAILSLSSTTSGFLPPRMTTTQRDAIVSPATGLFIFNTSTGAYNFYTGSAWTAIAAGGTINSGTSGRFAYYASTGTTLSEQSLLSVSGGNLVSSATQFLFGAGSAVLPGVSFSGDPDTGVYSKAANELGLAANGTLVARAIYTGSVPQFVVGSGSSTEPALCVAGNLAQGFYRVPGLDVTGSSVPLAAPLGLSAGTQPGYTFAGDEDTGVTRTAANTVAMTAGGNNSLTATASSLAANVALAMGSNKITGLAAASANGDAVRYEQLQYLQAAVYATSTTSTTTTSTSYVDTSLTASITPTSSSSRIKITVMSVAGVGTNGERAIFTVKRNSTDFSNLAAMQVPTATADAPMFISYIDSPATTSSTTYTLRVKSSGGGTVYDNPVGTTATITLEEIR